MRAARQPRPLVQPDNRQLHGAAPYTAHDGVRASRDTRAFGFEADRLTLRPEETEIVRDCARRFLAGESIRSITSSLNERRIPTTTGGAWSTQVLRRMLNSGRISGRREHRGEIVADAEWDGIISAAQSDRIRAVLADPARRTNRSARRYLLAGLLRCGRCKGQLVARPRDDGTRRYVCARTPDTANCGRLTVVADPLEHHIAEAVLYRLDTPALTQATRNAATESKSSAATRNGWNARWHDWRVRRRPR